MVEVLPFIVIHCLLRREQVGLNDTNDPLQLGLAYERIGEATFFINEFLDFYFSHFLVLNIVGNCAIRILTSKFHRHVHE